MNRMANSRWRTATYANYVINQTFYIKSKTILPVNLQAKLEQHTDEIFIRGVPKTASAAYIAEVAAIFGEIYRIRFKLNADGTSRGIAFLKYMCTDNMKLLLEQLNAQFGLMINNTIVAYASHNRRELLLQGVEYMQPTLIYELLCKIIKFEKLICFIEDDRTDCEIYFKTNDDAVVGHKRLSTLLSLFGRTCSIMWSTSQKVCKNCAQN